MELANPCRKRKLPVMPYSLSGVGLLRFRGRIVGPNSDLGLTYLDRRPVSMSALADALTVRTPTHRVMAVLGEGSRTQILTAIVQPVPIPMIRHVARTLRTQDVVHQNLSRPRTLRPMPVTRCYPRPALGLGVPVEARKQSCISRVHHSLKPTGKWDEGQEAIDPDLWDSGALALTYSHDLSLSRK